MARRNRAGSRLAVPHLSTPSRVFANISVQQLRTRYTPHFQILALSFRRKIAFLRRIFAPSSKCLHTSLLLQCPTKGNRSTGRKRFQWPEDAIRREAFFPRMGFPQTGSGLAGGEKT